MKNVLLLLLAVLAMSCSNTSPAEERNRIFENTDLFWVYETKDSVTYIGARDGEDLFLPCNYIEKSIINENVVELKHKNGQLVYLTKEKYILLAYNTNIPIEKSNTPNPPLFGHTGILIFLVGMLITVFLIALFTKQTKAKNITCCILFVVTFLGGVAHPYGKVSEKHLGYRPIEEQSLYGLANDDGEISLKKEYVDISYFSNDFIMASKSSGNEGYIHFFLDKDLKHYVDVNTVVEENRSNYAYDYHTFVFDSMDCVGALIICFLLGAILTVIVWAITIAINIKFLR